MRERETFQTHLRQAATGILERVPEDLKREIYVLAFNIWRIGADNRHSYVDIGYNTESQYEDGMRRDSDAREVRWNYAFWILEGFDKLGNVPEDPVGAPLYQEEARNLGIWYDGEFDLGRMLDDDELRAKSGLLELHFHDAVIDLARYLHTTGTIERIFGRPLPVVVFDMDCPGWEEEATKAANPVWGARSPLNQASAATMAAAGMVEEGRIREHVHKAGAWRDSVVHAMLDREWRSDGDG